MGTVLTSVRKIRFWYIGGWLRDQLNRPDWFRNLFVNRSAWGVFSIYAHARRSDGKSKIAYSSKAKAEKAAFDMAKRYGYPFATYKCLFCDGWHVSKAVKKNAEGNTTEEIALDKYAVPTKTRTDGLDVERILATGIPDLALVYGGFRGRTLSSTRQLHAWNTMIDSGIMQVIDLRADYSSDFYSELCQRSGISYFKYPVAYEDVWIAKMVEMFPEFCKLIDNGRFYIACAMGLHRTDIALCTYWVFYAADKGIAPPPICGYRKDKGLTTNKIMRVLNAFYKYRTEKEGKEPIPMDVFLERKEIIKQLSRGHLKKDDEDVKLITGLTFCSDERGITCQGHSLLEKLSIHPIGEGMLWIGDSHGPLFFANSLTGKARQLLDEGSHLVGFEDKDFDWEKLKSVKHTYDLNRKYVDYGGLGRYDDFRDGVCSLCWMLYPDGRYFADEDGYGMEDNEEENVSCVIDCDLRIVRPWQPMVG